MQPKRFTTASTKTLPILSQTNPYHTLIIYLLRCVSVLSSHLKISKQSGILPSCFPTDILCSSVILLTPATCSKYHILLEWITPIISSTAQFMKLLTMQFLQPHDSSSCLRPNMIAISLLWDLLLLSIGPRWLMPWMYCSHIGLLYCP